ncbi:response regulator transcription factor [Fimbriiglobus ruber]|uniref:Response regulatory domain-containing protein n=1 Tax=Fimbriiglobus ruber TaxID=1908690 RepID=A0A225CY55_9BACT|nr:response regulator transcription factor [Fimbriiglobus ruber]OWK34162.1 hypothetical protein FRUB_10133 [Fimbriiglobus ruber]
MSGLTRALLVDDDEWFRKAFRARLRATFPNIELTDRAEPDVSGQYEIYFLDNQFGDVPLAAELVQSIRRAYPKALVIALSGRLDAPTLKRLINEGCNGACEKGDPDELARTFDVVRAYLATADATAGTRQTGGLGGTIRLITDLLREWNNRLDGNDIVPDPHLTAAHR